MRNEQASRDTAPSGSIRFNTDSAKMEIYNGEAWWEIDATSPEQQTGGTRGVYYGGGDPGRDDVIQYINIASKGNSIDFGNAAAGNVWGAGGCGSRTRGVFWGGENQFTKLDYITFASTGNAVSFGSGSPNSGNVGVCDSTRGAFQLGASNGIEYVTMASTGNALDFGDTSFVANNRAGGQNPTRGVLAGGYGPSPYPQSNVIEYINIQTTGNASDFGDLTFGHSSSAGASNAVRMLVSGGYTFPSPATVYYNNIEYITIATLGNAIDFGDMTDSVAGVVGVASPTRAAIMGGEKAPGNIDEIDYVQFATKGNATDFGRLLAARRGGAGASNGHGGLG